MGKYSAYGKDVDGQLDEMFKVIIKTVRENVDAVSIVLFGGFGKGEGSVYMDGKKAVPFNDFDFYVITREKERSSLADELTEKASKAIGAGGLDFVEHPGEEYDSRRFFHVDIRLLSAGELPRLKKTQRTFELKYASQVLWGDKEVMGSVPDIAEDGLPVPEGIRPVFNKMDTLLLCMDKDKLSGKISENDKRIIIFYSMKAYLTCAEALLILSGHFKPTYSKRSVELRRIYGREFPELEKRLSDLPDKVDGALRYKLKLKDPGKDAVSLWFEARDTLGTVFRYVMVKYLSLDQDGWKGIIDSMHSKMPYIYFRPYLEGYLEGLRMPKVLARVLFPSQYILNIIYAKKLKKEGRSGIRPLLSWRDVGLRLAASLIPLLYSIRRDGTTDEELKELSRRGVGKIRSGEVPGDFESLRKEILELYGLYYLQKLI